MSILDVGEPVFSLALSSTLGRCPSSRNQSGATFPSDLRLATGTLMDSGDPKQGNHFDVWGVPGPEYEDAQRVGLLARANINFPATKVGFAPVALKSSFARGEDMLATTTDVLTLWDFRETDPSSSGYLGRSPGSPQYALHQKSTMGQVSATLLPRYDTTENRLKTRRANFQLLIRLSRGLPLTLLVSLRHLQTLL